MVDQNYFNDYADANGSHYNFRNFFIKQKDLCEIYQQLQPNGINNLTLRLCLLQHAFCELFKQTLEVRQKTRKDDYEFKASFNNIATSGVVGVYGISKRGNIGENVNISLHNVHQHFYLFCTFAVGVLDRLAVEVKECYNLTDISEHKIDWGYFFKEKEIKWKKINKCIDIIFMDSKNSFYLLRKMRNTLEHRNFFNIKPGEGGDGFDYFTEENIPLTDFTKKQLEEILILCNSTYDAILKDYQTDRQ